METTPCSRVIDKEFHTPHTYYFGGQDVHCDGYSPARLIESDEAETPEEFFGVKPIQKNIVEELENALQPSLRNCSEWKAGFDHEPHIWDFQDAPVQCQGYDSELERLLYGEVEELKDKYANRISFLYSSGLEVDDIAMVLDEPLPLVYDVLRQMNLTRVVETPEDRLDDEFHLSDLSLIAICAVVFTAISFVGHAIIC